MSTTYRLSVLAFASTVLASPFAGHGHHNAHRHLHTGSGSVAPFPYASANSTRLYGTTGTGYASPTGYGSETTSTNTLTHKTTLYTTIYETVYSSTEAASGAQVDVAATGECGADVTVTNTEKVTVTVTAGDALSSSAPAAAPYGSSSSVASAVESSSSASGPAYSAPAYSAPSSSSEAAPVSTSSSSASAPAYSAPAYSSSSVSSSVASPVTTSSSVAPSSSAPAYTPTTESSSSSSVLAILPSSYSVAEKGSGASATSSAPASYSSTASSSGGKRGLAYNDAALTDCFSGSGHVSWAYNWLSSSDGLSGYKYIPMLHSNSTDFTGSWESDAQSAIDSGSTTLFSFNEPDIASQANMDAASAAAAYKQYMNQFDGKAALCAPAVSNGEPDKGYGLGWLQDFKDACDGGCNIDCYAIHWYGTEVQDLKDQTTKAIAMADGKPVWVSEFAITGLSDDGINSFLEEIMPWFDSNDDVAGYAYYMVSDGLLVSGTSASTYGKTYMS